MKRRILGLSLLTTVAIAGCATTTTAGHHPSSIQAVAQPKAAVQNRLSDCASVSSENVIAARNVLLLPVQLTLSQSIGACGCMTSLMRYRVSVGGPNAPLSDRDLVVDLNTRARRLHETEALHLVLAPDAGRLASVTLLTVELTCAPAR
jgi:hypothetical protein